MATKFTVPLRSGVNFQTTNSDLTEAVTFATANNKAYFVEVKAVAIDTNDFASAATYWRQAAFKNDAGTLAIVGAERTVVTDNEPDAGWQFIVDADSTNIRIRVASTGTVNWRIDAYILEVDAVQLS